MPARVSATVVDRGAVLYAAYCAGCHGEHADGHGRFAARLGLTAADLRAPALRAVPDRVLVERIMHGPPLEVPGGQSSAAEDIDVAAIAAYLPELATGPRDLLRSGRVVYEGTCAACHGAYGRAEGALSTWLGVPDLLEVRSRYTDPALARISRVGIGRMPALPESFQPGEVRALVAYVRHLSPGFRLYDTYCAACHGDDGLGVYSRELIPAADVAPPLRPPYPPERILHMLRRQRLSMPHLRSVIDADQVAAIVAYLRTLSSQERQSPAMSSQHR
jgi:mono/diheme cytochrome c family protein